jgi:hypothetical protein
MTNLNQVTVAFDIGAKDGSEFTFETFLSHGLTPFGGLGRKDSEFEWLRGVGNHIRDHVRYEKSLQVSWRRRIRINLTGFIPDSIAFGQENENPNT